MGAIISICVALAFFLGVVVGVIVNDVTEKKIRSKKEKEVKKEEGIEDWGSGDRPIFVSVPRAVAAAKAGLVEFEARQKEIGDFKKFCEGGDLEKCLKTAEISWTMIDDYEHEWIRNESLRTVLHDALLPQGFKVEYDGDDCPSIARMFFKVVGRA